MFVRNRTEFSTVLAKGLFADDLAVLSVGVEVLFDIGEDGGLTHAEWTDERADTDPPDVRQRVLWSGTSVTAFTTVTAPAKRPFARTVRFSVGDSRSHRTVDMAVYGNRHWERGLAGWAVTEPSFFDKLPLSWERAFGGTIQVPPHRTGDGLPHPGGAVPYPLNPTGRGLVIPGSPVEGMPLPNVENPHARVTTPDAHPTPYGVAPCPALVGLRMTPAHDVSVSASVIDATLATWTPLRSLHHAPNWLIFDSSLEAGTPLALQGHGEAPVQTRVPRCPAKVRTQQRTGRADLAPRVRSVHLDAGRRQLRVTWSCMQRYEPLRAPRWIDVEAAA